MIFPKWFMEKYKVELSDEGPGKKEPGKYWVKLEDVIRLQRENKLK